MGFFPFSAASYEANSSDVRSHGGVTNDSVYACHERGADGTVVGVFDGGSSRCLECEDVVQAAGFGKC
jgi:hypothetical protein